MAAPGLKAFRKIEIGKEATRGTAVAANKFILGTLQMTKDITWHEPDEDRGSLARFHRRTSVGEAGTLRFEGPANYEQLIHFLAMAVKGGVVGVQQALTTAYLWTFSPNYATKNAQDSYTIEFGDDIQAWESNFALISSLELGLAMNEVAMLRADIFGRPPVTCTFTALSAPTVINDIIATKAKIYVDSTWATLGTTPKSDLLIAGTVRLPTGIVPVKYADGNLYFSSVSEQKRNLELDLTFAFNSDANTERGYWEAGTMRFIRLEIIGALIASTYYYTLRIDMAVRYTTWSTLEDRDGEDVVRVTAVSEYDPTGTKEFEIVVTNKETAL